MPSKLTTREMNLLKRAILRKRALKRASPISVPRPDWHVPANEAGQAAQAEAVSAEAQAE